MNRLCDKEDCPNYAYDANRKIYHECTITQSPNTTSSVNLVNSGDLNNFTISADAEEIIRYDEDSQVLIKVREALLPMNCIICKHMKKIDMYEELIVKKAKEKLMK